MIGRSPAVRKPVAMRQEQSFEKVRTAPSAIVRRQGLDSTEFRPHFLQMSTKRTSGKGDAHAFRQLYDANHQRVCRFINRVVGSQETEDLAQIVFAKAARALPDFRGDAQAATWLYRIAANVVSDWLRSRSVLETKVTIELPNALDHATCGHSASSASQENQASPEQELSRKEMRNCIRRLIGQLPEKHRSVLALAELGGLTDDEVAQALGISRGNAKVRLHRARAQLKNSLEAHCDFSRDEDNEFVCEPKLIAWRPPSKRPGGSSTITSDTRPGSKTL
jgi:RNA polymerase sigma-70 factor (ECF subfamily)